MLREQFPPCIEVGTVRTSQPNQIGPGLAHPFRAVPNTTKKLGELSLNYIGEITIHGLDLLGVPGAANAGG